MVVTFAGTEPVEEVFSRPSPKAMSILDITPNTGVSSL
jgi:hypothetical protein